MALNELYGDRKLGLSPMLGNDLSFINLYLYKYENICLSVCLSICLSVCLFVHFFLGHFETD